MLRALISFAAAAAAGIVAAIALAIIDLYLTGHGMGSITRETIAWDPGGVHMSVADVIMLVVVLMTGVVTWQVLKGKRDGPGND